jgi:ribosomal protein L18E
VTNRSPARSGFSAAGTTALCTCVDGAVRTLEVDAVPGDVLDASPVADPVEVAAAHPARSRAPTTAMEAGADAAVCLTAAV